MIDENPGLGILREPIACMMEVVNMETAVPKSKFASGCLNSGHYSNLSLWIVG